MKLRQRYRRSGLPVIPEHWEIAELGDIAVIRNKKVLASNTSAGTQCVELESISSGGDGRLLISTDATGHSSKYSFENGDVLFGRLRAYLRKYWLATFDGVCSTEIWPLIPLNNRLINSFLHLLVQTDDFVNAAGVSYGTHMPRSDWSVLKKLNVLLPPVAEQRAVATALSDVDELLDGLNLLIAKKRDLKQATMRQLLTGKTRLPGFSGAWKVMRLDDLADIRSGGTPSTSVSSNWGGHIPWCTPTDITALNGHKFISATTRNISEQGLRSSSAELIPPQSIVMTSRATIGACAINTLPMTTNQGFKNFVPRISVDVDFLYYFLQTQTQGFISLCGGSTFLEIGKAQLCAYEVNVPDAREEQTAIAAVLSDMDAELAALEARRDKTRLLKQGMMQELLTGKTRLVNPETSDA